MATLGIDNSELVRAVLVQSGLGRDAGDLDAATEADVRSIIRKGLRRFYTPVQNDNVYQWNFLKQPLPFSIEAIFDDGTIEVSGGTVTLTGGTWPTEVVDHLIYVGNQTLFITSRDSGTEVTITHDQLEVASGTSYTAPRYRYDLPSDFSELLGGFTYADGTYERRLIQASESELRLRYQINYSSTNDTTHYAMLGTDKVMFWPIPEPDAFIQGQYLQLPDDSLPADLTTPGSTSQVGPLYADALLQAILAAAEAFNDDTQGLHERLYQEALYAAIQHDRTVVGHYQFQQRFEHDDRSIRSPVQLIDFEP